MGVHPVGACPFTLHKLTRGSESFHSGVDLLV
jgi:hypothetical protein